jgi:outer membrane protein
MIMKSLKHLLVAAGLLALVAAPALAYDEGTWIFRAGVGTAQPKSDNYSETIDGTSLSVDVDNGTSMTLSGTYMFTERWALDILASLPFSHDIDATLDDGIDSVTVPLAETKHLPPTVSIQYHFAPDANFQPYVGLGANWTTFFDTDLDSDTAALLGLEKLELDDSFGVAAQLGGDWRISDRWLLNIDVRYIDIETDTTIFAIDDTVDPPVTEKLDIGTVEIDPWVYSINLGYRF